MSVMDLKSLYRHNIDLLLPKSNQIIKNIGKRIALPTISPRERTLKIKAPAIYRKKHQDVVERGEYTQRCQNQDIQKLKELFERSIHRDQPNVQPLPTINKSPLRVKSTEPVKKASPKVTITTYRKFQGSKPLINKKREKNKPIFSINSLTVVSRSLSKKSFEKSIIEAKEVQEKKLLLDKNKVNRRKVLLNRDSEVLKDKQETSEIRENLENGQEELKDYQNEVHSESDEDRMEIYHEFKFD